MTYDDWICSVPVLWVWFEAPVPIPLGSCFSSARSPKGMSNFWRLLQRSASTMFGNSCSSASAWASSCSSSSLDCGSFFWVSLFWQGANFCVGHRWHRYPKRKLATLQAPQDSLSHHLVLQRFLLAWMAWIMGGVDAFGCESASELLPPTFWEPHPSWSPILHHPVERLSPSVSKYWGTPTKHHRQLVCNYGLQLSSSDRMIQTCSGETVSVTRWLSPVICAPNPTQITSSCSKPLALLSQLRMSSSFLKSSCTASSKKRKESSNETSWMLYVGTQSASKRSSRCNLKLLRNFLVWYEQCHVPTKLNTGVCVCVCVCA